MEGGGEACYVHHSTVQYISTGTATTLAPWLWLILYARNVLYHKHFFNIGIMVLKITMYSETKQKGAFLPHKLIKIPDSLAVEHTASKTMKQC